MAVAALCAAAACTERSSERYATFADAERSGAVERGWVPQYVPREATEISERHDLDTNAQRLRFRVPAGAVGALAARLERVRDGEPLPSPPRYLHLDGWPAALEGGVVKPPVVAYRARLARGGADCVAIDGAQALVFAWTCEPAR